MMLLIRGSRKSATSACPHAGMKALASALRGGAMPSCKRISLDNNPGDDAPVNEALARR